MTCRLLVFCLSLTLLSFPTWNSPDGCAVAAQEAPANNNQSEFLLPASTKAWVSIPDYERLQDHFKDTDFGKLTQDEKLKPFISSLEEQFKGWLNQQNLRLGVKVEDLKKVRTGEICLAGVLQQAADGQEDKLGRGSHGMVLLVDVSKTEDQAKKLMVKVDKDFETRGAKQGDMQDIHGIKVTKWTVHRPKMLVKTKSSYHAIAGGWLLVSDNENIFREIIRRLTNVQKVNKAETLALQPAFKSVLENTAVDKIESDVRWYVDPFGYLELTQAIEREDQVRVKRQNDVAGMLKSEGFNVLRGVGGFVSFATGEHELLHRTFIHAPRNVNGMTEKRFFGLFDFENKDDVSFAPADWVPSDISAYVNGTWDMTRALNNVGGLVDSIIEEGAFDNVLKSFKTDMNVDIPKLVKSFGNQIIVVSATAKPVTDESEQVAICLPIDADDETLEVIKRAMGGEAEELEILGKRVMLFEESDEEFVEDPEMEIFGDPNEDQGDEDIDDGDVTEEFTLFKKKYITLAHGNLIIANKKDFLKKIIQGKPKNQVTKASDYVRVNGALAKLTEEKNISFKHFGRVDETMKINYEMIRQGKMGSSNTVLARVINRVIEKGQAAAAERDGKEPNASDDPRDQKLDGSKLPEDFDKFVGPYFGPTGSVVETGETGWRITGCMIKKKPASKLVHKQVGQETSSPKRR